MGDHRGSAARADAQPVSAVIAGSKDPAYVTGSKDPACLTIEGMLFRAALLAGHGARAAALARRLAAVTRAGGGRSCLEAGAPIQLTVDAPGPPSLRVGLRLGDTLTASALGAVMPEASLRHTRDMLTRLPPAQHSSLGAWLFWSEHRQSVFVDLRDPLPADAVARLHCVLDRQQRERFERLSHLLAHARPWALRIDAEGADVRRLHLHWLIERRVSPAVVSEAIAPGAWPRAVAVLGTLLRRPESSGRWVVATPLDGLTEPALRIGNTGWALAPEEDDRKHRVVADVMQNLGGPRDYAEALWSLCRGAASADWRVGRACELRIAEDSVRARLFFTPQVQVWTTSTAGTSSSDPLIS